MEEKYPVIGHVETKIFGVVPILDVPMMDDEREKELGAMSAAKWKGANAS